MIRIPSLLLLCLSLLFGGSAASAQFVYNPWTGKIDFTAAPSGGGGGAVSSVFGRTGTVAAQAGDYASFYPRMSQTYTNPSWITSLDWAKIVNVTGVIKTTGYGLETFGTEASLDETVAATFSHDTADPIGGCETGKLFFRTDTSKLFFGIAGVCTELANKIHSHSATEITSGLFPLARGGTNNATWTSGKCVQVSADGTKLEAAAEACGTGSGGGSAVTSVQGQIGDVTFPTPGSTGTAPNWFGTTLNIPSAKAAGVTGGLISKTDHTLLVANYLDKTIENPTASSSGKIHIKFGTGITINRISCSVDQGSVQININQRTEAAPYTTGATDVLGTPLTCTPTTGVTTTFGSAGILVNRPAAITFGTITGDPTVLNIHVTYTKN